jgi:hypothetical protein
VSLNCFVCFSICAASVIVHYSFYFKFFSLQLFHENLSDGATKLFVTEHSNSGSVQLEVLEINFTHRFKLGPIKLITP